MKRMRRIASLLLAMAMAFGLTATAFAAEVVNETFSAREMIVGVSDSEEMEFMIKFQNAFNASSRYVNVINEMIEHILSTLGR